MHKPLQVQNVSWWHIIRNLLIALAVIGSFSYAAFPLAAAFGLLANPETRLAFFLAGTIVGELAALGVLVLILRREGIRLSDLGFGKPATWQAFGLAFLVVVIYCGVTAFNPFVGSHLLQWSPLKALALLAAIVAGLVEEMIFRGYLMTAVMRMGYGKIFQVLASGILFALAHLYGFTSLISLLGVQVFTLALGLALGGIYLIGKRSLTPVILCHALIDMVIEPWLLLSFFRGQVR